jgi:inner membrane protein
MDPFTHGLAGAAASQSFADKDKIKAASFAGFVSALLADLDTFIFSSSDPLLNVEIHRQLTHSIIVIPLGALIAALLVYYFLRKYLSIKEIYLFSLAGYATSGILDSFTSYGTQLLWPFTVTRFSWNLISVVDPIFTIGLFVLIVTAVVKKDKNYARIAGIWVFLILINGFIQKERAESAILSLSEERNHLAERIVAKPTIGNQILWRVNYIYNNTVYTDAVRTGLFSSVLIYEGSSSPLRIPESDYSHLKGTVLYNDILRFSHLSEGYLVIHPDNPLVLGDARYSMLPTDLIPLWGIEVDTSKTTKHAPFLYFRDAGSEIREPFKKMLLGRSLD